MIRQKRKNKKHPPKFLQPYLWSYDLSEIDLDNPNDQGVIITQVLNYGTLKDVQWLFKTYSPQKIKKIIKNPHRGVWFPETLNYWDRLFRLNIPKKKYQEAVFNINPQTNVILGHPRSAQKKNP